MQLKTEAYVRYDWIKVQDDKEVESEIYNL